MAQLIGNRNIPSNNANRLNEGNKAHKKCNNNHILGSSNVVGQANNRATNRESHRPLLPQFLDNLTTKTQVAAKHNGIFNESFQEYTTL